MNTISFITANFVAREAGYALTEGWHQGNNATNDYFRPIDTFPKRFEALLKEIKQLGFRSIDLWISHLHWAWATKEHTKIANSLVNKHRLQVANMTGDFGSSRIEFEASCQLANAMEVRLLVGSAPFLRINREEAVALLRDYNLQLALVNRQESSVDQFVSRIGYDNHDILGVAVDTGWFQVLGERLFEALEELAPNLKLVQLKNLQEADPPITCRFDKGLVPIQRCVDKLQELRFNGPVSIEHQPFEKNPGEECRQNLEMLKNWLGTRKVS
ncbi:MAG: sugar phosphate isomerase/epimerase [Verrucomicrobiae bacterium]|nr:sugar phosphate isomerase/epimerase [Verrucomicrobiae bacterium]